MPHNKRVLALVERAVDEVNQQRPDDGKISRSTETALVGESGTLDSLGLVALIVAVEEEIEKEFQVQIRLTEDESLLSGTNNPIQSIGGLVDYITRQLEK